jgi:hypothetical protein
VSLNSLTQGAEVSGFSELATFSDGQEEMEVDENAISVALAWRIVFQMRQTFVVDTS